MFARLSANVPSEGAEEATLYGDVGVLTAGAETASPAATAAAVTAAAVAHDGKVVDAEEVAEVSAAAAADAAVAESVVSVERGAGIMGEEGLVALVRDVEGGMGMGMGCVWEEGDGGGGGVEWEAGRGEVKGAGVEGGAAEANGDSFCVAASILEGVEVGEGPEGGCVGAGAPVWKGD